VFNLLPLPPLGGGRIAVGLLPRAASSLARLEPYGMATLIGVLFTLLVFGAQMGLDFSLASHAVAAVTNEVIAFILLVTGNT
jgi:Zn-dependent protease